MNLIRFRVILGIGTVLAGTSARPDEPARTAGSSTTHDNCPFCRKEAQLKAVKAEATLDAAVERASFDPARAPLDPDVQQVQVPPTSEPLTPKMPVPPQLPEPPAMPVPPPAPPSVPPAPLPVSPPPPPGPSTAPPEVPSGKPRARFLPPAGEPVQETAPGPGEPLPMGQVPPAEATIASPQAESGAATSGPEAAWPDEAGPRVANRSPFGFSDVPVMIGDQAPASLLQSFGPGAPPLPHATGVSLPPLPTDVRAGAVRAPAVVPWARGFKIAENQSPQPQDRVFASFNYFNDLDGSVNRSLGSSVTSMQAYRYLIGAEKTFLDGNASLGIRLPINVLSANSVERSFGGTSTSVGNATAFGKYLLWTEPVTRSLISAGLAVTVPNGPSSFAGAEGVRGFHDAQIQPFLGYIFRRGDLYVQGFSAIDAATSSSDVTMFYNDIGLGYFLYRAEDPEAFLSALVPTFEVHINDPLNHCGALRFDDPAGTADVVDLTFGSSFVIRRRGILSIAYIDSVTGPRPFGGELAVLFNLYFGGNRFAQVAAAPPVLAR